MATKKEVTYFTKVRGLATVVWDPKKNRPVVEFDKQGLFGTEDPELAATLKEMGYKQVTAAQITQAGLMLPEAFQAMRDRQPGRGYTQGGPGRPAMAAPQEAPGESPADALFNPEGDDMFTGPVGGRRTLVK